MARQLPWRTPQILQLPECAIFMHTERLRRPKCKYIHLRRHYIEKCRSILVASIGRSVFLVLRFPRLNAISLRQLLLPKHDLSIIYASLSRVQQGPLSRCLEPRAGSGYGVSECPTLFFFDLPDLRAPTPFPGPTTSC